MYKKRQIKTTQTNLIKYGTKSPAESTIIKEQTKQYFIEKYGVDNPRKSKEIKDIIKQKRLDDIDENGLNSFQRGSKKSQETCLKIYGVNNYRKTKECVNKIKQKKLELYGDENYNNPEQNKKTCLERYGVEHYNQTNEGKEKLSGKNCHLWRGGTSYEEYPKEFDKSLKKSIWIRDNYTCQMCNKTNIRITTHHIDYNKKNNNSNNLITLCRSCHTKTNSNREYWIKFFKDK